MKTADKTGGNPVRRKARASVVFILLMALLGLTAFTQVSCKASIETTRHLAACSTCRGSGVFGKGRCPTCRGIGIVKVHYSYPVIAPGKEYPDDLR